jgi:hypothetical protein
VRVLAVWHPSPDTPPHGLLPNMSESSGTPGVTNARGSFASVFPQASLVRASLRCSQLVWGRGNLKRVSSKKLPLVVLLRRALGDLSLGTEGSYFVMFDDKSALLRAAAARKREAARSVPRSIKREGREKPYSCTLARRMTVHLDQTSAPTDLCFGYGGQL